METEIKINALSVVEIQTGTLRAGSLEPQIDLNSDSDHRVVF